MVKVEVKQGWLEGEQLETSTGEGKFFSFKGIPYAAPPLGKLRFKAPQPPLVWNGIRKATKFGPKCPQVDIFTEELISESEDCLYLNVYSPNLNPGTPLAVMVFIHGGGFKSGSGDDDYYGPDFLMAHNVVLVTINYRLDALGFLCLDTEEVPGNAGMKDQVLALKWVQENIAKFGGDPNNVTIFGESAGGSSCGLHVLSPMSKGLFKRAIPMSGVPFCDWSQAFHPRKRAFVLGKQLGLETDDPNELLEFLQSLPVEKLISPNPCLLAAEEITCNNLKMFHFTPVAEKYFGQDHFLTEAPFDVLKSGKINDVDVLIGCTNMEVLVGIPFLEKGLLKQYSRYPELLVPRKILNECPPSKILEISDKIRAHYFGKKQITFENMKEFLVYANECTFTYDVYRYLTLLRGVGKSKKYFYRFSCYSNRNVFGASGQKYGITGASHLDDLMYLFDSKRANIKMEKNSKEYKMVRLACTLFTNFVKYGNPTPDSSLGVSWPEYDDKENYGDISESLTIGQKLDSESVAFWKSIYDYAGLQFIIYVESTVVQVNEGLLLGVRRPTSTGRGEYYSFKGIPYAEPPVGNLRFKDPIPHKPWTGLREALVHGPRCVQFDRLIFGTYLPGSEDCLFLNVYTPDLTPEKPLPVMFYIHGGAFMTGSGNSLVYGPDFIMDKKVILVTTNYRLDALGFLKLDTKDVPGNAGLKDQNLALKWVHDNIHKFGGDPNEVTLIGQSAGSASVTYHMMSPMSKGLFKRAIALSGVPFCEFAISYELTKRSFALGNLLGSNTTDPDEMLKFLQEQPAYSLVNKVPIVIPEEEEWQYIQLKMTAFQPAPEEDLGQERFLVEPPTKSLKKGNVAAVDLLIGYTSLEYLFLLTKINNSLEKYNNMRQLLVPREILLYGKNNVDPNALAAKISEQYFGNRAINIATLKEYLKYQSDEIFVYNVNRFLKHLPGGNKRYLYKFYTLSERNRFSTQGVPLGIFGLAHSDDLLYLFESIVTLGRPVALSPELFRLVNQTVTLFTNFVKYGDPTPTPDVSLGVDWPEYDNDSKGYLIINSTLRVDRAPDADVNEFWTGIYEEGGVELP
ncbi:neuroligin-3-like [Ostrinia nubilalis]|uniref:neuroligin-3-like n=1 Tax=Ostrinia nubilalis TaxID=29057 RepID=UPI00308257C2